MIVAAVEKNALRMPKCMIVPGVSKKISSDIELLLM